MNMIGKQIDRYRILEQMGQGGMAVVYKAYDVRLERDVAIKIIRKDAVPKEQHERLLARFEREAKAQAKFSHPNIVPIFDYGEYDGAPYLVQELIEGGTLKDRVGKAMDYQHALSVILPIADAIAYAHAKGVVHRDIKPSNILLGERPMLTDFGIAKILETEEETLTGTGLGVGTPEYMAPEQWKGKPVPQTDIYALGVVFYELITGQKPYSAETPAAIAIKQVTEPLERPMSLIESLPVEVEKVLLKALAIRPEDRYETMSEFEEALRKLKEVGTNFVIKDIPLENVMNSVSMEDVSELETIDDLDVENSFRDIDEDKQNSNFIPKLLFSLLLISAIAFVVFIFVSFNNQNNGEIQTSEADIVMTQSVLIVNEQLTQSLMLTQKSKISPTLSIIITTDLPLETTTIKPTNIPTKTFSISDNLNNDEINELFNNISDNKNEIIGYGESSIPYLIEILENDQSTLNDKRLIIGDIFLNFNNDEVIELLHSYLEDDNEKKLHSYIISTLGEIGTYDEIYYLNEIKKDIVNKRDVALNNKNKYYEYYNCTWAVSVWVECNVDGIKRGDLSMEQQQNYINLYQYSIENYNFYNDLVRRLDSAISKLENKNK